MPFCQSRADFLGLGCKMCYLVGLFCLSRGFVLCRGLPSLGAGLENTPIEKGELESRMLVLLAHHLSACTDVIVGMESMVASHLINWEV